MGRDSVRDVLCSLADMGAVGAGAINLISLEPIRSRLGEAWPRERDQVWDHVESLLRRRFEFDDVVLRLDEVTVLVHQPDKPKLSAQARCVRACADLMKRFIGEASPSQVQIRVVQAIQADDIVAAPVPDSQVAAMLLAARSDLGQGERCGATSVSTRLGRELTANLQLQPLWNLLPRPHVIGHYARSTIDDAEIGRPLSAAERARLQPGELADIDLAVLRQSLAIRASSPELAGGLIVPVSYRTLANSSTRYQVLQAVEQLGEADRLSFGWEIVDLEDGMPQGRLMEIVALVRRRCRGVMCRMNLSLANAEKVHAAGAALTIAPPDVPYGEAGLAKLESLSHAVAQASRALLMHGVPPDMLPMASYIGATHCTVQSRADA